MRILIHPPPRHAPIWVHWDAVPRVGDIVSHDLWGGRPQEHHGVVTLVRWEKNGTVMVLLGFA